MNRNSEIGSGISAALVFVAVCFAGIAQELAAQDVPRRSDFPMISAHRGASRVAPENTLIAFSTAIDLGADFIEIDVRSTADGTQVIMHDGSLKRTTGLEAKVERTGLAEIQKLSAGSWFGIQYQDQKVPTLEEVCDLVKHGNISRFRPVKLYVDCKDITAGEVVRILRQYSLLDSAVFYGDINILTEVRKLYQSARLMPAYPGKEKLKEMIHTLSPYALDVPYGKLDEAIVKYCHANGVKVFSDLLGEHDTALAYKKAIELKVDLIQTDDISGVLQAFNEFK